MEKLKFIHNTIVHWIDKTDSKANIILGIKLFITGYFLTLLSDFSFGSNCGTIILILFAISSLIAYFYTVRIIYPKLSTNEPSSLIYFKHLYDKYKNNKRQGAIDLNNFSDNDFKKDLSNQIISLSMVARCKYKDLQKATGLMILEIIFFFLFRILFLL